MNLEGKGMADLLAEIHNGRAVKADGRGSVVAIPEKYAAIALPFVTLEPTSLKASIAFEDLDGFLRYVKARSIKGMSVVFLTIVSGSQLRAVAVIDYHGEDGVPGWCDHVAVLTLEPSPAFQKWIDAAGRWMSQEDFATFIDDNAVDVDRPESASLVEMALKLEGTSAAKFTAKRDPATGSCTMSYEEDNQTGAVKVPRELELLLPVLDESKVEGVKVALMWRLNNGRPTFAIRIPALERIVERACKAVAEELKAKLDDIPVMRGVLDFTSVEKREVPRRI